MILVSSTGLDLPDPSGAQFRVAVESLNLRRDGEAFLILQQDGMTYMQVSGDARLGFDMEYQSGALDQHYRAKKEAFTSDEVVKALTAYRDGTINWVDYGEWYPISLG